MCLSMWHRDTPVTQTSLAEDLVTWVCLPWAAGPLCAGAPELCFCGYPVTVTLCFSAGGLNRASAGLPQHISHQKKLPSLGDLWLGCNTPHTPGTFVGSAILHCPTHRAHAAVAKQT